MICAIKLKDLVVSSVTTIYHILPYSIRAWQCSSQEAFPNLRTALGIWSIIPVAAASEEWSFARLRLIKNLLRTTPTRKAPSHLAGQRNACCTGIRRQAHTRDESRRVSPVCAVHPHSPAGLVHERVCVPLSCSRPSAAGQQRTQMGTVIVKFSQRWQFANSQPLTSRSFTIFLKARASLEEDRKYLQLQNVNVVYGPPLESVILPRHHAGAGMGPPPAETGTACPLTWEMTLSLYLFI